MRSSKKIALIAGAVLLVGMMTGLYAAFGGKPHLMDQKCSNCHLAGDVVDATRAGRLLGSQEMLCGICHKDVKKMSHPSGFAPAMRLPADLPLDWKGDMTCSTCHEVHGSKPGLMRGDKHGKALCMSCHDTQFFSGMKDAGVSLQQSGHAIADMTQLRKNSRIDALSLQCMGCHNNQGDVTGIQMTAAGVVRHNSGGANHPIGIPYPMMSSSFKPRSALPSAIWLPNGKLSCVSCHQPYKKVHGQLVVTNNGSMLCAQCHAL
ncbi:doubled CXXCH motif (paired_CXXCH_1) [mine drainage metagenome]|uniref:Doubled CXXCH motif (Paired_CXXCH_1) n=1 Tax=mine drainage metagenome TaxID=410659 RepID=A0A1J5P4P7_9ZZZZ